MNVVIDGAGMQGAANEIRSAVRTLSLIGQRVQPLLESLRTRKGMSSNLIDAHYKELADEVTSVCKIAEQYQDVLAGATKAYIDDVDELDRFLY